MQSEAPTASLVIVDDDPHLLGALRFAFEIEGYRVSAHAAGEEILSAPPFGAACIIIDQNLPGASGMETVARLRGMGVLAPAILITSHPSLSLRRRAEEGRIEIIEKPLTTDALSKRVQEIARG